MTAEEMFDLLYERHCGTFSWRMLPFTNHDFVEELRKELQPDDPLRSSKTLYSVAQKEACDDILFLIGSRDGQDVYRIYHLTHARQNMPGWPRFREFVGLDSVMSFLEEDYLSEAIDEYEYLWIDEKDDWSLVGSHGEYSIVNFRTQSVLLMEDEYLNEALVSRMKEHGCAVFGTIQAMNTAMSHHWQETICPSCTKGFCSDIFDSPSYRLRGHDEKYRLVTCPKCGTEYLVLKGAKPDDVIPVLSIPQDDMEWIPQLT